MKTRTYNYGGSPGAISPAMFSGSAPRVRLSTPPLEFRRQGCQGCVVFRECCVISSMNFDLLFDGEGAASMDDEAEPMEVVFEEERQRESHRAAAAAVEEEEEEYTHALDPVSVYVRIVGNLSRPLDALEHNIAKRFAAACTRVGAGELGDQAHIEELRRAFNGTKMDPVFGFDAVDKTEADYAAENAAIDNCTPPPSTSASDCQAFVATTPGAAGHAALLNLRHSFLWLKPSDASVDAAAASHVSFMQQHHLHDAANTRHHPRHGDAKILVLEPDIKAHFVISRPTPGYQRLVNALPDHFVGTHKRLVELVDFVCEQMLVSFRENGMSMPPWRKNKSILSKWFLPTARSRSQPTTPTASPPGKGVAGGAGGLLSFRGVGLGAGAGVGAQLQQQQQQLSRSVMNESLPCSSIDYAAPVVGEAASPNKVEFGFTAARMAVAA